jgi:phosphohistidine phosphatase SixA
MLQARGWIPDVVLASNAKRTRQTLEQMTGVMTDLSAVDSHLFGSLYTVNALDGQTRQHIEV